MGQVDESFLAIETIHTLIILNDSFSEVPEDLQSILTDSSLHNSSAELTTKEILSRYGDIVRGNVAKQTVQAADAPAQGTTSAHGSTKSANPVAMRVDVDPSQANAWQKQSSVRPVQNFGPPSQQQQTFEYGAPNQPYSRGHADSDSDQASFNASRQSYGNKPQLGVTG